MTKDPPSSEMFGFLTFALIGAIILVSFYYQRKLAGKMSIEPIDYWDEIQWDEPETGLLDRKTPEEIKEFYDRKEWGPLRPVYTCPHCHKKGFVRTKSAKRKCDISVAKAIGLALRGGWALLGAGLTKGEQYTQAHCENCGFTWEV